MPLEIKEIIITASVSESADSEMGIAASGSSSEDGRAELIADCVEQVLEILSEKREP